MVIDQSVKLLLETTDEKVLAESLRDAMKSFDTPPPVVEANSRTHDVAIYDSKVVGESVTHPHLRIRGF
eukprot:3685150-Lingulodinium_polyedra.AAC.1